jgi:EmrB/QacA subfamily drug resistance transporter
MTRWAVLVLLGLAQFMLIVDITVVQVALPSIGTDLGLGRVPLTWVVTTYTLVFGGLMVLGGRLADAFGARRVLLTGLAVFTAASLLCGLASSGGTLIAGRAAQGLGAALMSPAALSIITTTFHGRDRHRALGVWAALGGTGAAVGVLLSGLLTAGPGWEWVFFVNVPVGVLIAVLLPSVVAADRPAASTGVDLPGAVLVTAATAALIYGIVNTGALVAILGAAVGYVAFLVVESRTATPLLRPQTMARRPVVSGAVLMLVGTGLLLGLFFLASLYFQHLRGFSALRTGLLFLPVAVAITVGAQLGAHLISRIGGRAVVLPALLLVAAGTALLTRITPDGNVYTTVLPGLVLAAFGIGPVFVTATTTTLANVPHDESGVASGVLNTFHELGGSIGVAVLSTVAAASIDAVALDGFTDGFLVCAIAALAAAVLATALVPAGRPKAVAEHGH